MMAESIDLDHKCAQATCRSCGRTALLPVLDLGAMPLADGLLDSGQLDRPEPVYPLEVAFCPACALVQILESVPPRVLFGPDYPYFSSFSPALLAHARSNALSLIDRRRLNGQSLVVEVASNDGYLLRNFREFGIPVLGIDPADGPADAARTAGITTLGEFFGIDLARRLVTEGKQADVIIANNVLAHAADTNGFVAGIRALLKEDGLAVIEVPYVRDLVDHGEFDTIYHEHLCYFSVTAVEALFRRNGLFLNDVQRLPIHGGSLRLFIEQVNRPSPAVGEILAEERRLGIDRHDFYRRFGHRVLQIRQTLRQMLLDLKARSRRIAAYGAAAKGSTLLNYLGVGTDLIDFVVDRNTHKQGRYMPGSRLPIHDPGRLLEEMPDFVLLLTWNFRTEILQQQAAYRQRGGRFIIPIPSPEVV